MKETIFKVGDKVFDYRYRWGEVVEFTDGGRYGVCVDFNQYKNIYYTIDGRLHVYEMPTLSFTEYTLDGFSQERPEELPEEGQIVWARNNGWDNWVIRHFIGKIDGEYICSEYPSLICPTPYDQITTENPNK